MSTATREERKVYCPCGCSLHLDQFSFEGDDWANGVASPWSGFYWAVLRAIDAWDSKRKFGDLDAHLGPFSDTDAVNYKAFVVEHARRTSKNIYRLLAESVWFVREGCLFIETPSAASDAVRSAYDFTYTLLSAARLEDPAIVFASRGRDSLLARIRAVAPPQGGESEFRVYRLFNQEGVLLYVGKTNSWTRRMRQHERDADKSGWWCQVAQVILEPHDSEQSMSAAEMQAIRTENPLFNKVGRAS